VSISPDAIRAITFDLDDTLWPFAPIALKIESALDAFFREYSPQTARMYPPERMHALRARIWGEHPELAHDVHALRQLTILQALRDSEGDAALLEAASEVFLRARNEIEFYPDTLPALARLHARMPIAAITNGNADLGRIGLDHLFAFRLSACEFGAAKPAPGIFHAACERLGCAPSEVLHVGDSIEADVLGASRAGLRSCWIKRADMYGEDAYWPHMDEAPDLEFSSLTGLADWVDLRFGNSS